MKGTGYLKNKSCEVFTLINDFFSLFDKTSFRKASSINVLYFTSFLSSNPTFIHQANRQPMNKGANQNIDET